MRIALVVASRAPLGPRTLEQTVHIHRFTIAQARALAGRGAEVDLFVDAEVDAVDRSDAVAVHRVARPAVERLHGPNLIRAALRVAPDVVHQYNLSSIPALAALALARRPHRRAFAEYNGGAPPVRPLSRSLMRIASVRVDGLFFTSAEMASPFIRAEAVDPRATIIAAQEIASLVPIVDRASARRSLGAQDAVVLVVARAAPEKDPRTALDAFEIIRAERPGALLVWAALERGPLHGEVEAGVRKAGGRIAVGAEMAPLYAAADVMLHPSLREVCGAALVEALTAGVPAAVSDIPAFRALVGGGARLCGPGDPRAFADVALALLADPNARDRAKARGAELTFDRIAERKLAVYRGEPISTRY